MKFETMITFWKMRDNMIRHQSCITNNRIYDSDKRYATYSMIVCNGHMHANILYKFEIKDGVKSKFALIHADILYSGFPQIDGQTAQVCIKNAKVSDLRNEFMGRS